MERVSQGESNVLAFLGVIGMSKFWLTICVFLLCVFIGITNCGPCDTFGVTAAYAYAISDGSRKADTLLFQIAGRTVAVGCTGLQLARYPDKMYVTVSLKLLRGEPLQVFWSDLRVVDARPEGTALEVKQLTEARFLIDSLAADETSFAQFLTDGAKPQSLKVVVPVGGKEEKKFLQFYVYPHRW